MKPSMKRRLYRSLTITPEGRRVLQGEHSAILTFPPPRRQMTYPFHANRFHASRLRGKLPHAYRWLWLWSEPDTGRQVNPQPYRWLWWVPA